MPTTVSELLVKIGVDVEDAKKAQKRVDDLKQDTKKFGAVADRETTRAARGFQKIGRAAHQMSTKASSAVSGLVERMGGLRTIALAAGAALAAAAVSTFRFVDSQTASLDSMNKLSASIGVGVEELQRLQFAASQSGVSSEKLSMAVKFFNKNLLDMSQGGGKLAEEALTEIGVKFNDLQGLSRTEQIGRIGDALQGVGDQARRSALAARIFGEEAGPSLASLLNEGSQGIDALTASAKGVLSQAQVDQATKFQDLLGETKNELTAVAQSIAVDLLPEVRSAVVSFKNWISENREFIGQAMSTVMDLLAGAVKRVAEAMQSLDTIARAVGSAIDGLGISSDGAGFALDGLGLAASAILSPFTAAIDVVNGLAGALIKLNVVSAKTSEGLTPDQAINDALAAARKLEQQQATTAAPTLGPFRHQAGPAPRKRAGGGGGGGGGGGRAASSSGGGRLEGLFGRVAGFFGLGEEQQQQGVDHAEALRAILSGGGPSVIGQRLEGLAGRSPSPRDIKPTVAMDVTINNVENTFNINSTDPKGAAEEMEKRFRTMFRRTVGKAALSLASDIAR